MKASIKPHIHITPSNITVQGLDLEDTMRLLGSAYLQVISDAATKKPDPRFKEALYDVSNTLFSNVLERFAPEIEMRPDLTVEAILEAENRILDRVAAEKE